MLRLHCIVVAFVAVSSCRPESVSLAESDVYVDTTPLDFGQRAVGFENRLSVSVENLSQIPETLSVSVEAPFIASRTIDVPAYTRISIPVFFRPTTAGGFSKTVLINGRTIFLKGAAVALQECPANSCASFQIDSVTGECHLTNLPNGTTCTSAIQCIQNGMCQNGTCVGAAQNCDDGNKCTTDSCSSTNATGCEHTPTICAAPANKCLAARCDATLGCVSEPVADGTNCGTSTCELANVCMSGTCRQVVPPNGFACDNAGPCDIGHCENKVCRPDAKVPLTPLWSYENSALQVYFEGITDAAENLYWYECQPNAMTIQEDRNSGVPAFGGTACFAVSYTGNGVLRFRTPFFENVVSEPLQMIEGNQFFLATADAIHSINTDTGMQVWQRNLFGFQFRSWASAPATGSLWISMNQKNSSGVPVLKRFSASSGAELASYIGHFDRLVVAEDGALWGEKNTNTGEVFHIDTAGNFVVVPISIVGAPLSIFVNTLVTNTGAFNVLNNFKWPMNLGAGFAVDPFAMQSGTAVFSSYDTMRGAATLRLGQYDFVGANEVSSSVLKYTSDSRLAGVFLLSENATLSVSGTSGRGEVQVTGTDGFTCAFNGSGYPQAAAFGGHFLAVSRVTPDGLTDGHRIDVFQLPALELPLDGWVTPHGTRGHAQHAQLPINTTYIGPPAP
jgi:hypothetical protein